MQPTNLYSKMYTNGVFVGLNLLFVSTVELYSRCGVHIKYSIFFPKDSIMIVMCVYSLSTCASCTTVVIMLTVSLWPSPGEDNLINLDDPEWADINIVTGCLKLYLRELPDPVIPFRMFRSFIDSASTFSVYMYMYVHRASIVRVLHVCIPLLDQYGPLGV